MRNINLVVEGLSVRTQGLSADAHPELRVSVADMSLLGECETFLKFVADYVGRGARIRPGETLAYGYWLTKFSSTGDGLLDTWEHQPDAADFVAGATLTLTYWREQHDICRRHGGEFTPPRPNQIVVVSDGVLEGDAVQGVRYPSPEHMSGWWITTDRYDGNIKSLRHEHLYHLTSARPDLAPLIALPYGFRFDLAHREDVWFDREVLR